MIPKTVESVAVYDPYYEVHLSILTLNFTWYNCHIAMIFYKWRRLVRLYQMFCI